MIFKQATLLALIAAMVSASPCPFGQMFERGELSDQESAAYIKARDFGHPAVEQMMDEHKAAKQKRELEQQETFYKRQLLSGALPLGGGLVNGVLQPFTGALKSLDVPTPQPTGLVAIPDDDHPYAVPSSSDIRGMCPTLNTMANHGYISRSGITTFAEAADACQTTLGFGYDTCTFLSALGLLAGGDLPTGKYSIGGADSRVPNTIGPALGVTFHGPFEIDQSISRSDQYFTNQANFNLTRWERWAAIAEKNGGFNMATMNEERQVTYTESRDNNPYFDAEAKHLAVSLAERVFIFRALPNGTHEDLADYQNVAPFYLNETFPKNWFRRAEPYTLPNVGTDIAALYLEGPTELGHNEGLNNFIPLGLDLTDGSSNTFSCLLAQSAIDLVPGQISPAIAESFDVVSAFFNGAIAPFFAYANCGTFNETAPNKNSGLDAPGPSAESPLLVDGVYQPVN